MREEEEEEKNYTFKEMLTTICGVYCAARHCEDIPAGIFTNNENVLGGACSLLKPKREIHLPVLTD